MSDSESKKSSVPIQMNFTNTLTPEVLHSAFEKVKDLDFKEWGIESMIAVSGGVSFNLVRKDKPTDLLEKVNQMKAEMADDKGVEGSEENGEDSGWSETMSAGTMDESEGVLPGGRSDGDESAPERAEGISETREESSDSKVESPDSRPPSKVSVSQIEDQALRTILAQHKLPIPNQSLIESANTIRDLCLLVRVADRHISSGNPLPPNVDLARKQQIDRTIRSSWESLLDHLKITAD